MLSGVTYFNFSTQDKVSQLEAQEKDNVWKEDHDLQS